MKEQKRLRAETDAIFRDPLGTKFRAAAALEAERAHADAERERMRGIAQDYLATMEADGAECTCEPGDTCPLCRVRAALRGETPAWLEEGT